MLALDARRRPRLRREALDRLVVLERSRLQRLDRDALLELQVVRLEDNAHAPDGEHAVDAIFPRDDLARLDGNEAPRIRVLGGARHWTHN